MFRIEAFVDDKRLAEALRALSGIARGQPTVLPVINVREDGTAATSGTLVAMFEAYLGKSKKTEITPDEIRAWLKSHGKSPASTAYLVKLAIQHHLLRRVGKSSGVKYIIIPKKKD